MGLYARILLSGRVDRVDLSGAPHWLEARFAPSGFGLVMTVIIDGRHRDP